MGAPIVLEEKSKIRHLASLRSKDPDMRFFTIIVEHEPSRWELNHVVHITAEDIREVQKKTYQSKQEAIDDFYIFRNNAIEHMQEEGIEFTYDEYPVEDKPQNQQVEYINMEFGKEMGFLFNDRKRH